jgi:hypothetical protein
MNASFCVTELLYRGSEDGWSASTFHSKVDDKGAVICIIRSSNGNIFGGYTKIGFDSSSLYKADSDAFLFSVTK